MVFADRLRAIGSQADIVIIVTFAKPSREYGSMERLPQSDLDLIASKGIKLKYVQSIWDRFLEKQKGSIPDAARAAEKSVMYNKIFAWEMTEYDWVQVHQHYQALPPCVQK